MSRIINFERLEERLTTLVNSDPWKAVSTTFREKPIVILFGHGGNMGVTAHLGEDIARLTDKTTFTPDSAVLTSSLMTTGSMDTLISRWLTAKFRHIDPTQCLVIGCSCSVGTVSNQTILNGLQTAQLAGASAVLWCGQSNHGRCHENIVQINVDRMYYHSTEVLFMMMFYQLIHEYTEGKHPPPLPYVAMKEFEGGCANCDFGALDHSFCSSTSSKDVPPGFEQDLNNLAVDFDGVIHQMDRGYWDGTCYGPPVSGSREALEQLSKRFRVIVFSGKCKPDRPLVHGKTGKELVKDWLVKHDMLRFVSDITSEKPRAQFYIDDKAIAFSSWDDTLKILEEK